MKEDAAWRKPLPTRVIARIPEAVAGLLVAVFMEILSGKAGNYLNEAAIFNQTGKGDAVHPSERAAQVR